MRDYDGPERRDPLLQEEVRELRTATATLSERVNALSIDFRKVNELTVNQQEVDRRSAEAVVAAASAIAAVRAVEEQTVPRDEIEEKERAARQAVEEYRRRAVARTTAGAVIGTALTSALLLFAVNYANGYKDGIYNVCIDRSAQSTTVRAYLDQQRDIALKGATTPEARAQVIAGLDQLKSAFPDVKCGELK